MDLINFVFSSHIFDSSSCSNGDTAWTKKGLTTNKCVISANAGKQNEQKYHAGFLL